MDGSSELLQEVFQTLDTECRGFITREQFKLKFKTYLETSSNLGSFNDDDLNEILSNLDPDKDNNIDFNDFKNALSRYFSSKSPSVEFNSSDKRASNSGESNDTTLQISSSCLTDHDVDMKTDDSGVNCFTDNTNFPPPTLKRDEFHSSWPKRGVNAYDDSNYNSKEGRSSPLSNSQSDVLIDDVEILRDQVRQMVEQMEMLNQSQANGNDSRYRRVKEENDRLTSQLTILEERHKELEARSARDVADERNRYQAIISRMERDHELEVESLRNRYNKMETDFSQQRIEVIKLETRLDVTSKELKRIQESYTDAQGTIRKMQISASEEELKINSQITKLRMERDQIVRELNQEMGEEQTTRIKGQLAASDALIRYQESQEIVRRLTEENRRLQVKINEMQEELLSSGFEQGQILINSKQAALSLADELNDLSREELCEKLLKEQQDNARLQDYIRRMLEKIMEKDPELLQI